MKIGVLLSGCGVFDGSEIHEAVFTLLSIAEHGAEYVCIAPDITQHHVLDHTTGNELPEKRNVLIESARIARGNISRITDVDPNTLDALVIPGGFGAAKNLTKWAFSGPDGEIDPNVRSLIGAFVSSKKPVAALCMGPTVVAKALEGRGLRPHLTVGTTTETSPYDIAAVSGGMEKTGAVAEMRSVKEISIDTKNLIVSAPCYMMDASITEVRNNVKQAIDALFTLLKK